MSHKHYRNEPLKVLNYTDENRRSLYSMLTFGVSLSTREAEAVVFFGRRMTYGELIDEVDRCAAGMVKLGIKKGDFVTIFLPNIPQCVVAIYALNRIGAVCNMVHPLSTKSELEYAVKLTESKYVLTFEANEANCEGLGVTVIRCKTAGYFPHNPKGTVMKTVYNYSVRNCKRLDNSVEWSDIILNGKMFLENGGELPEDTVKGEDLAMIMYTGGTTGDSKGVELSNHAINYSAIGLISEFVSGISHIGAAMLSALPAFHAFGFVVVIHLPLASGMRLILLPRFNPKQCAKLVLNEQVKYFCGVPVIFERLYPYLKDHDLSFVIYAAAGGDVATPDLRERYNKLFGSDKGGTVLKSGYGLTEVAGCCLITRDDIKTFYEGCIGSPLPGTKMCLVEPGTTEVVPEGKEGELCILNPGVMTGYYKNEKATAEVIRKHDDGNYWLHTGDVVTVRDGDTVVFESRYKRMVKINGINVYPTQIENTMSHCGLVREVCAVAVPWKNDRRIKLYVTLTDGSDKEKSVDEIMNYAKAHLNHWSTPKEISVIDKMPVTKMNKTDYRVLEKRG